MANISNSILICVIMWMNKCILKRFLILFHSTLENYDRTKWTMDFIVEFSILRITKRPFVLTQCFSHSISIYLNLIENGKLSVRVCVRQMKILNVWQSNLRKSTFIIIIYIFYLKPSTLNLRCRQWSSQLDMNRVHADPISILPIVVSTVELALDALDKLTLNKLQSFNRSLANKRTIFTVSIWINCTFISKMAKSSRTNFAAECKVQRPINSVCTTYMRCELLCVCLFALFVFISVSDSDYSLHSCDMLEIYDKQKRNRNKVRRAHILQHLLAFRMVGTHSNTA